MCAITVHLKRTNRYNTVWNTIDQKNILTLIFHSVTKSLKCAVTFNDHVIASFSWACIGLVNVWFSYDKERRGGFHFFGPLCISLGQAIGFVGVAVFIVIIILSLK